jgi:hypothetical protein
MHPLAKFMSIMFVRLCLSDCLPNNVSSSPSSTKKSYVEFLGSGVRSHVILVHAVKPGFNVAWREGEP